MKDGISMLINLHGVEYSASVPVPPILRVSSGPMSMYGALLSAVEQLARELAVKVAGDHPPALEAIDDQAKK